MYTPVHAKPHALPWQTGCEFAGPAGQTLPQVLQLVALLLVSTQLPLHSESDPLGQPVLHWPPAHTGVVDGQALVHEPHVAGRVMSVSQPSSGLPSQSSQPAAHADVGKEQAPAPVHVAVPVTCARFVQSWPQVPQLCTSLGTQEPPQSIVPDAHDAGSSAPASAPVGPASTAAVSAVPASW